MRRGRRAPGSAADAPRPGLGPVGVLGLAVAAAGWGLLLAKTAGADLAAARGLPALAAALRADIGEVAGCLIGSGFALAIVGALREGFGALNRFFETALARSAGRAPRPAVVPADEPVGGAPSGPTHDARPYRTLPDGSVEVETIVGTRRFASMAQARDFI